MNLKYVKLSLIIVATASLAACGENGFLGLGSITGGSGGSGGGGFSGGKRNGSDQGYNNNGQGINGGAGTRGDVDVDWGDDDITLYVPATIHYNGEYSGTDAQFSFFTQRISPAPERQMREIIKAQGDDISSSNTLDKFCRCGKTSTFYFFWEHKTQQRRGALHNTIYNQDATLHGDWMISNTVSDHKWLKGNLASVTQGSHSIFLGADTENPGSGVLAVNKNGVGYLRTWCFQPNSKEREHIWENRDDMRIAISCDVSKCPEDKQDSTEIRIKHHKSHEPSFSKPPKNVCEAHVNGAVPGAPCTRIPSLFGSGQGC